MRRAHLGTIVILLAAVCVVPLKPATAQQPATATPEQRFFDWTELEHDLAVYENRRQLMAQTLYEQGVDYFMVPSAHGRSHGTTFRQTNDFMYFTGLELPHSVLVMDVKGERSIIYAPRRDSRFESASRANDFPGRPLADDPKIGLMAGISELQPYTDFEGVLASWIGEDRRLSINLGRPGMISSVEKDFIMDWNPAMTMLSRILELHPGVTLENAYDAIARLRMVKSPEEIDLLRRVISLTEQAIQHAAGFVREGVDERMLEAELEAVYKRGGAQRLSFSSIIKSGPNSLWPWRILAAHHDRRNRQMNDGDLVIFDVGTELNYYISDVGRTFPVSGSFTAQQTEKLSMITAVSDAVIAAVRPGTTLSQLLQIAVAATPENERQYMQTGSFFGHHIGMTAGDPSLIGATLESGMVFTIEPWYYNHHDEISVFIEDVILVTESGAQVLTSALPRDPEELAALVGKR